MKNWWRWLLVLPAALSTGFVVLAVILLAARHEFWLFCFIPITCPLSICLFCPMAFVLAGAVTAPAYQTHTGIALTILVMICMIGIATSGTFQGSVGICWLLASPIIGLIGCITGLALHDDEEAQRRRNP